MAETDNDSGLIPGGCIFILSNASSQAPRRPAGIPTDENLLLTDLGQMHTDSL